MSNPAKKKGTQWESDLVRAMSGFFAGRYGIQPRRVAQSGMLDDGDVKGIGPFLGQAKAYANLADGLRLGLEGAEVQRVRAGEDYGVALVKRTRKSVGQGYAVLTVATFARVLVRLRRAEVLLESAAPALWDSHVAETRADLDLDV